MSDLPLRCKCRKQAITSLRCSRCFVPICPDCSRSAAVGMLCVSCGRGGQSHLYEVGSNDLLKGSAVSFLAAIFGGWLLATLQSFGFFFFWFCFLYGLAVAELALRATGRKRGAKMEIIVGSAVGVGLIAGIVLNTLLGSSGEITETFLAILRNPWSYVCLAIAVFSAVARVRHL